MRQINDFFKLRTVFKIIIVVSLFTFAKCTIFHKKHTIIEPTNVQIVDESRVDNSKIRHIFEEVLLTKLVDKGKGWLTICAIDTFNTGDFNLSYVDYLVSFDIMDYGVVEIEKGTEKLLVSIKIIKVQNQQILHSYVESTVGKDVEKICQTVVDNTVDSIINRLISMQKRAVKFEVPDMPFEPGDSL